MKKKDWTNGPVDVRVCVWGGVGRVHTHTPYVADQTKVDAGTHLEEDTCRVCVCQCVGGGGLKGGKRDTGQ
jgi:hypothetical protein